MSVIHVTISSGNREIDGYLQAPDDAARSIVQDLSRLIQPARNHYSVDLSFSLLDAPPAPQFADGLINRITELEGQLALANEAYKKLADAPPKRAAKKAPAKKAPAKKKK